MATRICGQGTVLTVWPAGSTTSGSTTIVGAVQTITAPGTSADDVETTTLDTTGNYKTFKRGRSDPGEMAFTVAYDPDDSNHQVLGQLDDSGDAALWEITYASTATFTQRFTGYVKGLGAEIADGALVTSTVTVKVSGDAGYST